MPNYIKLDCPDLNQVAKPYKWPHAENLFRLQVGRKQTHFITESEKYHFVDGEIKHRRSTKKASKSAGSDTNSTKG